MHKGGVLFETGTVSRGGREKTGPSRGFLWECGPAAKGSGILRGACQREVATHTAPWHCGWQGMCHSLFLCSNNK